MGRQRYQEIADEHLTEREASLRVRLKRLTEVHAWLIPLCLLLSLANLLRGERELSALGIGVALASLGLLGYAHFIIRRIGRG